MYPQNERTARFASVLVFIDEDGTETVAEGFVEGRIGFEGKGQRWVWVRPVVLAR